MLYLSQHPLEIRSSEKRKRDRNSNRNKQTITTILSGFENLINYSSTSQFQIKCSTFNSNPNWNVLMGQPSTARRGGRENGGGRKKELVQFLLRIYNGPHVANFTAKFRLQCMKCLLFPLCRPLRITYEEPSHLLYLFLASFAFP